VINEAMQYDERDLKEWIEYEPIVAGLKHYKKLGIFFTALLIWRRIIMLFVAMFLEHYPWIQVLIFVYSSLGMSIFLGYSMPFITKKENRVELFNEFSIMTVGILAMAYVGFI